MNKIEPTYKLIQETSNINYIGNLIYRIFKKYNDDYIKFEFTIQQDSQKQPPYTKWNFYTPTLSHKWFTSKKQLIEFLENILKMKPKEYETMRLKELKQKRSNLQDELQLINQEIQQTEKEISK